MAASYLGVGRLVAELDEAMAPEGGGGGGGGSRGGGCGGGAEARLRAAKRSAYGEAGGDYGLCKIGEASFQFWEACRE